MALDLDALETSFDLVAPRGDELVDTFYSRLFAGSAAGTWPTARAPSTTPSSARSSSRRWPTWRGEAWRPEYQRAWTQAVDVVAGAMLEGAAPSR